jgi:hypothetical protein
MLVLAEFTENYFFVDYVFKLFPGLGEQIQRPYF